MSIAIALLFLIFFCVRLLTLAISINNERRLKQAGAREYGALNSRVLAILHVVIYVAAMAVLFYVIHALRPLWTVKLIVAQDHVLNTSPLFKYTRHPNYFLNILPELVGLALLMKCFTVLVLLFPLYLISLGVRIVQEEKIMRQTFADY